MKKVFKWSIIIFAGLMILGGIASALEEDTEKESESVSAPAETDNTQKEKESSEEPKKKKEEKPKNDEKITKAEFLKIENGMTYEQVIEIIGSEGELLSETGDKGSDYHTVMYQWKGKGFGASANATFQGGELISKAQFGLAD